MNIPKYTDINKMNNIKIKSHQGDYEVFVGEVSVWHKLPKLLKERREVLIVSTEALQHSWLPVISKILADFELSVCILPDGEAHKNQVSVDKIFDALMAAKFSRDCTVVALGGGVVGDMSGFAAATFMRGVRLVQLPTTLLAQVDSSIGGKTGINHRLGKNLIGAFWSPMAVLANIDTLATLPMREYRAGLAEVVKYALIGDKPFLDWLWCHRQEILAQDKQAVISMIVRSCQHKAQVVGADEKEQGQRAWLNFGHTFGHAIENFLGYGVWLHGEAVSAGMVQAAKLSCLLGDLSLEELGQIEALLSEFGLPIKAPAIPFETAITLMGYDKKVRNHQLHFVLLKGIGQAYTNNTVPEWALHRVIGDL